MRPDTPEKVCSPLLISRANKLHSVAYFWYWTRSLPGCGDVLKKIQLKKQTKKKTSEMLQETQHSLHKIVTCEDCENWMSSGEFISSRSMCVSSSRWQTIHAGWHCCIKVKWKSNYSKLPSMLHPSVTKAIILEIFKTDYFSTCWPWTTRLLLHVFFQCYT